MKNTKKKKALLLTTLSSLALAAGAVALSFGLGKKNANISAGSQVPYSVVFSRETGSFTRIDETTSSTSATTSNGATYYAIAHSNVDVENTGYIAQFGGGMGYDEQYITFSTSPTGGDDFEFQKITGIKIKTSSSGDQTLYAYYSADGESFKNSYPVTCNSNPSKVTFAAPQSFIRVGTASVMGRNIVSIELFYECGEVGPEPGEKTITGIEMYWIGEKVKQQYTVGDTFEPGEVKVSYSDSSYEIITEGVEYTGYDMNTVGDYTVSVSYGGFNTSYKIFVHPVVEQYKATFELVDVDDYENPISEDLFPYVLNMEESVIPGEAPAGTNCTFKVVFYGEATILGIDVEPQVSITDNGDGTYSFTMPEFNFKIQIWFQYLG